MCSLRIGLRNAAQSWLLDLPCGSVPAASEWVDALGKRRWWPRWTVAKLDLWAPEPPLVLRLGEVFAVGVERCASAVKSAVDASVSNKIEGFSAKKGGAP